MTDRNSPWADVDLDALHRVTDPAQAAIVADPIRSSFLRPFLGRACTVSEAAATLGCTPNAMLYRVRRMIDVGLLQIVGTRTRPGRPIKIYCSVHDGYFVPMNVMRYDDLRDRVASQGRTLVNQLTDAYAAVLFSSPDSGRALLRNRDGEVWATDLPPEKNHRGNSVFLCDLTVALTPQEALSIRETLTTAMDRCLSARPDRKSRAASGEPYLFVAGLLPLGR